MHATGGLIRYAMCPLRSFGPQVRLFVLSPHVRIFSLTKHKLSPTRPVPFRYFFTLRVIQKDGFRMIVCLSDRQKFAWR